MKISIVKCQGPNCNKKFRANRIDTKWCSSKCRTASRMEDAKFRTPIIPKSGVVGVSYNRVIQRWVINYHGKCMGSFKTLKEAIRFSQSLTEGVDS